MRKLLIYIVSGVLILGGCGDGESTSTTEEAVLNAEQGNIAIGGTLQGLEEMPNGYVDYIVISLVAADGVETKQFYASENGAFIFNDKLVEGESYMVSVSSQSDGQDCVVINGAGIAAGINIANIIIEC